jgi:3'-phosphoadenosine 5'-phosphosulfate sulfotransferase (PAPS reductase)/FAD synthetase
MYTNVDRHDTTANTIRKLTEYIQGVYFILQISFVTFRRVHSSKRASQRRWANRQESTKCMSDKMMALYKWVAYARLHVASLLGRHE